MSLRRSFDWKYQGVYYLAAGLIYAAIFLRSCLLYRDAPALSRVLCLLLLFLGLFLAEMALARRESTWFYPYLLLQAILVLLLIYLPEFEQYDYFSLLFIILGMQVMQKLRLAAGIACIVAFLALIGYKFVRFEGPAEGLTRLLLFGSSIVFPVSYSLAVRRTQEAHARTQSLLQQLQDANRQLQAYADTLQQLGVAHERQRMARELHDSVTQTIFSMTLTTQSALLLLERDPGRVGAQLERLNELAQGALAEMHTLIAELRPGQAPGAGLAAALRRHIDSRPLPEGLTVTLEVDGAQGLLPAEDQGLFRIAQEALNNVAKHASATRARVHLHLDEPYWIEIDDDGQGFDPRQPRAGAGVGLAGMRERADEIGWRLLIQSRPGEGTHIRVEKKPPGEERA